MDFGVISDSVSKETKDLLKNIYSNTDISPEIRIKMMIDVLNQTGVAFKAKVFNDVSHVIKSPIKINSSIDPIITSNLARVLARNYALNRDNNSDTIKAFFDLNAKDAQYEAFQNGKSMQNHPTLVRKTAGKPDCDWCRQQISRGVISNPRPEDFGRHKNCDCIIEVHGYRSRNGEVKNYRRK